jgi:hypothetical protein
MSILKKFLKNKKGGFALQDENYHSLEKPLMHDKVYEYHHEKAVLEDEKLYDTESAKKVFTYESSLEYITLCRAKRRAYFTTPHGNWFSAEEEVETESRITDVGSYCIQAAKTIYTYSDLRMEQEATVKVLIGKNDYELYKKYFGEVEEA